MQVKLTLLLVIATAWVCFASRSVIVHREGVPYNSGWSLIRKADKFEQVQFTITLERRNLDKLEALFYENSNPNHPNFATHYERKKIIDLIAPPVDDQKKVLMWIHETSEELAASDLISVDNQRDAIVVTSSVAFAEALFNTELFYFNNQRNHATLIKHMGQLSVPSNLRKLISMVTGITELPPVKIAKKYEAAYDRKRQQDDNQCNVPWSIRNLYNWPDITVNNTNSNTSVYAEESLSSEGFGIGSVADWEKANGLASNPINCILGTGTSWYVANDTDTEAQLDTQMVTGLAPNAKTCFYVMSPYNGWMYETARYIFADVTAPLVLSMSYGWFENDQCGNSSMLGLGNCTFYHIPNSAAYVNNSNIEFQKLGLIGRTVIVSAGDDGAAGGHGSDDNCETLGPQYPAASPFVTTVGATSLEVSNNSSQRAVKQPPICTDQNAYQCVCSTSTNEQVATNNNTATFDSGGGFSLYSAQPSYQSAAVAAYLTSGVSLPAAHFFNKGNRGYPDIAAIGENFCVLDPGVPCNLIAGTSVSAPLINAMATILNNDRLNAGKTPLGFLNQIIYNMFDSNPTQYFNNEFETANNAGECPSSQGYNTVPKLWSPVVGVGSPKFSAIREYIAQLK